MLEIILFSYLFSVTIVDICKKKIPFQFSLVCIVLITMLQVVYYQTDILTLLFGTIIGLLLLAVSIATRGAIGSGDGIMFLVIGSAVGFANSLTILAGSLLILSLAAVFLLVFRHVGKGYRIPFAPFAFFTYGGMIFFE